MSIARWLYVSRPVDYSPDVLLARELDYILLEMGERTPPPTLKIPFFLILNAQWVNIECELIFTKTSKTPVNDISLYRLL